jgi:hypothetical protein
MNLPSNKKECFAQLDEMLSDADNQMHIRNHLHRRENLPTPQ